MARALITGISGQDGSYLAELLGNRGYDIYGLIRRNPGAIRTLSCVCRPVEFLYGDMRDAASLQNAFEKSWPDEVYNLAAQVFVPTSWSHPAETIDINVGGLARLWRIIETRKPNTKIYQASSSEMFGNWDGACNEATPLSPVSPYGASKAAAHSLVNLYRRRGLFVVGGILFNHESPRRGQEMVTRKIVRFACDRLRGSDRKLQLGNVDARRDWGFAGDYVEAVHAMLQQPTPKDYVIGTGISHSVGDFLNEVMHVLYDISGKPSLLEPVNEYLETDPSLVRPNEIFDLRADSRLACKDLSWEAKTSFTSLVRMMVENELERCTEMGSV